MTSVASNSGQTGEILACRYLEDQGLRLLEKNYACKLGEIDLVMKEQSALIFIEVKTRKSIRFGTPLEFITPRKQQKIKKAALHYLQNHKLGANTLMRFDAIGVVVNPDKEPCIEWIQNAFYA